MVLLPLFFAVVAAGIVYWLVQRRVPNPIAWAGMGAGVYYAVGWAVKLLLEATIFPVDLLHGKPGAPMELFILVGLGGASLLGWFGPRIWASSPAAAPAPASSPAAPAPQLVGRACPACSRRVMVAIDATWCVDCQEAVHKDCWPEHTKRHDDE